MLVVLLLHPEDFRGHPGRDAARVAGFVESAGSATPYTLRPSQLRCFSAVDFKEVCLGVRSEQRPVSKCKQKENLNRKPGRASRHPKPQPHTLKGVEEGRAACLSRSILCNVGIGLAGCPANPLWSGCSCCSAWLGPQAASKKQLLITARTVAEATFVNDVEGSKARTIATSALLQHELLSKMECGAKLLKSCSKLSGGYPDNILEPFAS